MMAVSHDSVDRSPLGALIRSPLGAKNSGGRGTTIPPDFDFASVVVMIVNYSAYASGLGGDQRNWERDVRAWREYITNPLPDEPVRTTIPLLIVIKVSYPDRYFTVEGQSEYWDTPSEGTLHEIKGADFDGFGPLPNTHFAGSTQWALYLDTPSPLIRIFAPYQVNLNPDIFPDADFQHVQPEFFTSLLSALSAALAGRKIGVNADGFYQLSVVAAEALVSKQYTDQGFNDVFELSFYQYMTDIWMIRHAFTETLKREGAEFFTDGGDDGNFHPPSSGFDRWVSVAINKMRALQP